MSPLDGASTNKKSPTLESETVSAGRLELPTNGLKGHCSSIELRARTAGLILSRSAESVNDSMQIAAIPNMNTTIIV